MKKLINQPRAYVDEALDGMVAAFPDHFMRTGSKERVVIRTRRKPDGRVGVASGGGFGHLPLFAGYVGEGLLDSCAVGDVFAGPSLDSVRDALIAADRSAGVLAVLGNYGGDRMAFAMASEELQSEGKEVASVIVNDDVASAEPAEAGKRRGVAGVVLAFKIAGAAAEAGHGLGACASIAQRAVDNMRSIGVALSSCTIPTAGRPTFDLADDIIEMGMGIHGEKGVWRGPLKPADRLATEMADRILADMPLPAGARIALLCNSLGSTPIEELFIINRRIAGLLRDKGIVIARSFVGPYATSMEMAGASITILRLDPELEHLLLAPADCPFWY